MMNKCYKMKEKKKNQKMKMDVYLCKTAFKRH